MRLTDEEKGIRDGAEGPAVVRVFGLWSGTAVAIETREDSRTTGTLSGSRRDGGVE